MTAAARPSNKVDLLTNVPVRMSIKYIDVYPDSGKGYGASMRLKGTIDGAEAIVYAKGKVWAAVKALKAAGVIHEGEYADEPAEKYSISVKHSDVEMVMKQSAGERFASFTVSALGQTTPDRSHNIQGAHIAGIDEPVARSETGAPPDYPKHAVQPHPTGNQRRSDVSADFALYGRCLDFARMEIQRTGVDQTGGDVAGAIVAAAATLFIQAHR